MRFCNKKLFWQIFVCVCGFDLISVVVHFILVAIFSPRSLQQPYLFCHWITQNLAINLDQERNSWFVTREKWSNNKCHCRCNNKEAKYGISAGKKENWQATGHPVQEHQTGMDRMMTRHTNKKFQLNNPVHINHYFCDTYL